MSESIEDVEIPTIKAEHIQLASLYDAEVKYTDTVRAEVRTKINEYIEKCSRALGHEVDRRVQNYLQLIPVYWPMKYLLVGQSPYRSELLPKYASAFAFDLHSTEGFTPSVQVLSQFLSEGCDLDPKFIASRLSVSYVFVPLGLICINARVEEVDNTVVTAKLESYFVELLRSFVILADKCQVRKLRIAEFGDVAKRIGDALKGSLSTADVPTLRVNRTSHSHPALLARIRHDGSYGTEEQAEADCYEVMTNLGTIRGPSDKKYVSNLHLWKYYSPSQLSIMGNSQRVSWIPRLLAGNDIIGLSLDILHATPSMSNYRRKTKEIDEDAESYSESSLRTVVETSESLSARAMSLIEKVENALINLGPDDELRKQSALEVLESCVNALVLSSAMMSQSPGTLSSTLPATSLNRGVVPPILGERQISDVTASAKSIGRIRLSRGLGTSSVIAGGSASSPGPKGVTGNSRADEKARVEMPRINAYQGLGPRSPPSQDRSSYGFPSRGSRNSTTRHNGRLAPGAYTGFNNTGDAGSDRYRGEEDDDDSSMVSADRVSTTALSDGLRDYESIDEEDFDPRMDFLGEDDEIPGAAAPMIVPKVLKHKSSKNITSLFSRNESSAASGSTLQLPSHRFGSNSPPQTKGIRDTTRPSESPVDRGGRTSISRSNTTEDTITRRLAVLSVNSPGAARKPSLPPVRRTDVSSRAKRVPLS
jgi:hypothetical protein